MTYKNLFLSLISIAILLGLAGCAHYKAKPLARLPIQCESTQSPYCDNTITMAYHVFTKKDCQKYLDRNVLKKGFQPIQIAINNNTDKSLTFSTSSVNAPIVFTQEVAEELHTNTAGRVIGYGVGSLFLPPLIIPAIVDGVGSAKSNKKLDKDLAHKELVDQIIKPYSTINGLIFVSVDQFDIHNLAITLVDAKEGTPFMLTVNNPRLKLIKDNNIVS